MKTQNFLKGLATVVIAMLMLVNNLEAKENNIRHKEAKTTNILENIALEMETKYAVKFNVNATLSVAELNLPAIPEHTNTYENMLDAIANNLAEETGLMFDVNHTISVKEEAVNFETPELCNLDDVSEIIMEQSNLKFDVNQTISVKEANNEAGF